LDWRRPPRPRQSLPSLASETGVRPVGRSPDHELLFISNEHATILNMPEAIQLSPYLDNLRSLPFVRRVRLLANRLRRGKAIDGVLELTTPRGQRRLRVEEKASHLTLPVVRDLIARTASRTTPPLILFAPYVSAEMAAAQLPPRSRRGLLRSRRGTQAKTTSGCPRRLESARFSPRLCPPRGT
jgi:hypothetical protein